MRKSGSIFIRKPRQAHTWRVFVFMGYKSKIQEKNVAWFLPRPKRDHYKGGLLIVYHKYIVPNPNPEKYEVVKRVFIGTRVWHLPRVAIYFRKIV